MVPLGISRIETSAGDTQARIWARRNGRVAYIAVVQAYELGSERLGWGVVVLPGSAGKAQWFPDRDDAAIYATAVVFGFLRG